MMKVQRITLVVPYDDDEHPEPSSWDWTVLTDSVEPVVVVDAAAPHRRPPGIEEAS